MKIDPRYLAATQYTLISAFMLAVWWTMLSPVEGAQSQLEFLYSSENSNRTFFIWLAIATLVTVLMAVLFWIKRAATGPLALVLAFFSVLLVGVAAFWFDLTFILVYSLGCFLAVLSWRRLNSLLHTDAHARE